MILPITKRMMRVTVIIRMIYIIENLSEKDDENKHKNLEQKNITTRKKKKKKKEKTINNEE